MNDNVITVVVIVGICIGLPVALLLARDWFTRPSKRKIEEFSRQFAERLQHPDFGAVERHFGRLLPACVRALYADRQEILRRNFEVTPIHDAERDDRWHVAFYQPADGQSARDAWRGLEKYFAFADDGFGNGYLIDPNDDDPPVLFHNHETGELSRVCDQFTEFMRWPRLEINS
jgi:hypothetical protein